MAAIGGRWYASPDNPEDVEAFRFVFATQPDGELFLVAKVWANEDGNFADTARLVAAAPELLAALKDTAGRLEMVASDMRGGLLGHNIGIGDYEAGIRRCHKRAAEIISKAEGRTS